MQSTYVGDEALPLGLERWIDTSSRCSGLVLVRLSHKEAKINPLTMSSIANHACGSHIPYPNVYSNRHWKKINDHFCVVLTELRFNTLVFLPVAGALLRI